METINNKKLNIILCQGKTCLFFGLHWTKLCSAESEV